MIRKFAKFSRPNIWISHEKKPLHTSSTLGIKLTTLVAKTTNNSLFYHCFWIMETHFILLHFLLVWMTESRKKHECNYIKTKQLSVDWS